MKRTILFALAVTAFAQQPRIQNAKLDARAVSGNLETSFRTAVQAQPGPAWIGYSVPRSPRPAGEDESSWGCTLEEGYPAVVIRDANTPVRLEGPENILLLFRIADQKVQRIRIVSPDCLLDGGGLPFTWFNNVRPSESVSLLEGLAKDHTRNAIYAISITRDPSAVAALDRMVEPGQPEEIRKSAVMWAGYGALVRVMQSDPSDKVRQQAVLALARRKEAGAIPQVIRAAKEDKSEKVRRQAMNALARSKDPSAARFFEDTLR